MSKKDYELIAKTIAELPADPSASKIAQAFANALRGTNPNFDRQRFIEACCAA